MIIILNGKSIDFNGTNIDDLLKIYKLNSGGVAVEKNGEIVHREEYNTTLVDEGDRLEIVTFVGGG